MLNIINDSSAATCSTPVNSLSFFFLDNRNVWYPVQQYCLLRMRDSGHRHIRYLWRNNSVIRSRLLVLFIFSWICSVFLIWLSRPFGYICFIGRSLFQKLSYSRLKLKWLIINSQRYPSSFSKWPVLFLFMDDACLPLTKQQTQASEPSHHGSLKLLTNCETACTGSQTTRAPK